MSAVAIVLAPLLHLCLLAGLLLPVASVASCIAFLVKRRRSLAMQSGVVALLAALQALIAVVAVSAAAGIRHGPDGATDPISIIYGTAAFITPVCYFWLYRLWRKAGSEQDAR